MLLRKTDRKKHTAPVILTVGALAAIGAVSITKSGKQMLKNATNRVKGFFNKSDMTMKMNDNNFGC